MCAHKSGSIRSILETRPTAPLPTFGPFQKEAFAKAPFKTGLAGQGNLPIQPIFFSGSIGNFRSFRPLCLKQSVPFFARLRPARLRRQLLPASL
ncbi:hypothetical protein Z950_577 [Sulfitobacter mediterraneus KCTC 32188]|nr:hypothetical protein Z950_577 [Sulfitobacter mediterraneus KCTC 32188]